MVLFSKYPDIMKDFLNFFRKTQKNHQKFVLLKLCNTLGATDSFECVFKHCSLLSETPIKITFFFNKSSSVFLSMGKYFCGTS